MDQATCSEFSAGRSTTIKSGETIHATIVGSFEGEHDVFMNFRGEDTRTNIVDNLYICLTEAEPKINVFMDEPSLPFGEEIERKLLAAIERSKIAIAIISENYASSVHCLKELAHILRCMETRGLKVMPIFYKVNPSDVKNLRNSFERIQTHVLKHHGMEVESWKVALIQIGNMKGLVVDDTRNVISSDARIARTIVQKVKIMLKNPRKMNFNQRPEKRRDTDHLVGIDEKAKEIMEAISEDTIHVQIVGICGMGGLGKTTLARYIYSQLLNNFKFYSFVPSVRETLSGEVSIEQLISVILERGSSTTNCSNRSMNVIEQFLCNKKALIVLDDIDSGIEMRILMRMYSYFGAGSKIILVSRSLDVLMRSDVELVYHLAPLNTDQSMQLFSHHAFGGFFPLDWTAKYSRKIVEKTCGVPLLLELIGSSLFGKAEIEWESTFKALNDIRLELAQDMLLLCYQGLDDNQKQIFLEIACSPKVLDKHSLFPVWKAAQVEALDKLEALSLVKIDDDNKVQMHDLLRDLGKNILQVESIKHHNHLWSNESRQALEGSKEDFKSAPLNEEVAATPQLDEHGYFPESQPIACLDRLFDEINSVAIRRFTLEKKLPYSTQEAISLVDSFIKQISLPNAADVDFTSPSFLQSLESLRQPNALHKVPTDLVMVFHSALTSFAGTPKYLGQIQSAKSTFSKCTGVRMEIVDEIQKLKFKLDMPKNALQKTQRKIALLEDELRSLKAKERDLETELNIAIPTVRALFNELKTCTDDLVEAQERFDIIPTLEKDIKSNHRRVLELLHEIKSLLERNEELDILTFVSRSNYCLIVVILVGLFVSIFSSLHFQKDI